MFTFLTDHPRRTAILLTISAAAGFLVAHRSPPAGSQFGGTPMALSTISRYEPWRKKLDLAKAEPKKGTLKQNLPDGSVVTYTLDPELQRKMEVYLASYQVPYAAVVLYELDSREVKVMAGHSTEDARVANHELCLTPWAPAASIYKIITASALLQEGVPKTTSICYHGGSGGLQHHHLVDSAARDTTCHTMSHALAKSINPVLQNSPSDISRASGYFANPKHSDLISPSLSNSQFNQAELTYREGIWSVHGQPPAFGTPKLVRFMAPQLPVWQPPEANSLGHMLYAP